MTSFHSPERPRLANGMPAWLGVQVALPGLYIRPLPSPDDPTWWIVELILDGSWVRTELDPQSLKDFMLDWQADPEQALRDWFKREPPARPSPVAHQPPSESTPQSAQDLDL